MRPRACPLQGVVGELEERQAAAEQRAAEEEEVKAWILVGASAGLPAALAAAVGQAGTGAWRAAG